VTEKWFGAIGVSGGSGEQDHAVAGSRCGRLLSTRIGARNALYFMEGKIFQEGYSVAKERNNIYAITADAVDLALDTAGAIGSMVGGVANAVGLGSGKDKSDNQERREADDAAQRVSTACAKRLKR